MDIEWAKDGGSGELFVLQARPETVHSSKPRTASAEVYKLKASPEAPLVTGQTVGEKIGFGAVRVVREVSGLADVQPGDVLVAAKTDPDWELNVGDPSKAFALAAIPNAGVGLARIEFIVTNYIGIHPMALVHHPRLKELQVRIIQGPPNSPYLRRSSTRCSL